MEEKVDRTDERTETKAGRRIEFAHSVILQRPKCTCKVFLRYLAIILCNSPLSVVCQRTLISVFLSEKLAQSVLKIETENSQREKRVWTEKVSNKEERNTQEREEEERDGDGKTECMCGFVECKSKGALSREEKLLWCNVVCSASAQYQRSFW